MRILIVGSGGREHALAWKLSQSPLVKEIFIAPGNGGTSDYGVNLPIGDADIPALVNEVRTRKIDLVVPGPEMPLVMGLQDALTLEGVPCFGPAAYAARLEGSKAFSKRIMREAGVPTAESEIFEDYEAAKAYVKSRKAPMVVKADGLAAGKGVIVAQTREQALEALETIMHLRVFGSAGERVVVEEALVGEEASFLALCDGEHVALLPSAQDHKPVGEGDVGPNTGGMGAYSPAPVLPESRYEELCDQVIRPIVKRMAELDSPFKGVLYAGLMMTKSGPKVLEYNVRFGDPECQPLLMRLEGDLAEIMLACVEGRLTPEMVRCRPETALCVVMASQGYPGSYEKGLPISGVERADRLENVKVFQAGTARKNEHLVTAGGRVLGVTALGEDLASAQKLAYEAADMIRFEGAYMRRDIGNKGLNR